MPLWEVKETKNNIILTFDKTKEYMDTYEGDEQYLGRIEAITEVTIQFEEDDRNDLAREEQDIIEALGDIGGEPIQKINANTIQVGCTEVTKKEVLDLVEKMGWNKTTKKKK